MAWCTTTEVLEYTGITVTQANVNAAQLIIELFADTTEDASDANLISSKNLRVLKGAVAYQAAWLTEHPDAYTTLDVRAVTTDGMSWTVDNPLAGVLAPLARLAIARLSWNRNRSTYIRRAGERKTLRQLPHSQVDQYNAVIDDYTDGWKPLDL